MPLLVKIAGMFSIEIHTTQDVTSKDQCCIIIRYVTGKVYEGCLRCAAENSTLSKSYATF